MAKSKSAATIAAVVSPVTAVAAVVSPVVAEPATVAAVVTVAEPAAVVADFSPLVAARREVLESARKTGDVIGKYAALLCGIFNPKDINGRMIGNWFELSGKAARPVRTERDAFVAMFVDAGYKKPTIDVYWQRVKEASGYVTKGDKAKGDVSVDDKNQAEIRTIINRIITAQEEGKLCNKSEDVLDDLKEIFEALGGDLDKLK